MYSTKPIFIRATHPGASIHAGAAATGLWTTGRRTAAMQLSKIAAIGAVITALFITPAKADWLSITVDVSDQVMYVQSENGYEEAYPVSTARPGYHTPYGDFKPYNMARMHYSKKYDNAPMPNSIFFHGGYAIHATYDIKRLGRPASHGCVRLSPDHAARLYSMVSNVGMANTYINIVP